VLKECGIVIFSKSDPDNPDDQCLGGLISALYCFTQNGFGETLFRFTTDRHQYYIIERNDLLFAGRFSRTKRVEEKETLKELESVAKKFFERYSQDEIDSWDHDMKKFLRFHEDIKTREEIIGEYVDHLWDHSVGK
jgi:hypothetical protein